jgi:hypothetical protein
LDQAQNFTIYEEKDLEKTIKNHKALQFDMSKLEAEEHYETDQEHLNRGLKILDIDLYYAVEFFVHEAPLLFVENLANKL